jgi:hypothetical protein
MQLQVGSFVEHIAKQVLVDAGRIAANGDDQGVAGLCQTAKPYVVVPRRRAVPAGISHAGSRFAERC